MRHDGDTLIAVIRPNWSPSSPEQRALLADAVLAAAAADAAEEAAWAKIVAARNAGVPDTVICDQTNRSRATLNRRYGKRPTGTEA